MAFFLLLPFFLVRFGLLSLLNKEAVQRAAHFAPLLEREKGAYWLHQLSNAVLLIAPFFLRVKSTPRWLFFTGAGVYLAGLILLAASVASFAAPTESGVSLVGLYRFSRNPMYVA